MCGLRKGSPQTPAFVGKRRSNGMSEAAISNAEHKESVASDMKLATPWRRRWDSNPRAGSSPAKRFRVVPVMTTSIRLQIYSILVPQNQERTDRENKKLPSLQSPENKAFSEKFPKISNQFSSRARCDLFDTAPYMSNPKNRS